MAATVFAVQRLFITGHARVGHAAGILLQALLAALTASHTARWDDGQQRRWLFVSLASAAGHAFVADPALLLLRALVAAGEKGTP
eukprot:gene5489-53317_t